MKLYSTTTSERGKSVGKGGNEYINIDITSPDGDKLDKFLTIEFKKAGEEINGLQEFRYIVKNRSIELVNRSHFVRSKAKKQKCSYCTDYPCSDHDGSRHE